MQKITQSSYVEKGRYWTRTCTSVFIVLIHALGYIVIVQADICSTLTYTFRRKRKEFSRYLVNIRVISMLIK